jgi:tetratricopeptide (TPR) repeat protein
MMFFCYFVSQKPKNVKYALIVLIFVVKVGFAQVSPACFRAYEEASKARIGVARQILKSEKNLNTDSKAFATYVEHYADMMLLVTGDEYKTYQQLLDSQDKKLEIIDQLPDTSPYKNFIKGDFRVHLALAKFKFGYEVSGCWDVIKGYKLLSENARLFPNFTPHYKTLGLLHVLIGATPQNFRWVTNVLGLKGNIQQGLNELQTVIQKDPVFGTEAELMYIMLYSNILKYTEKQNVQLLKLIDSEPNNLLLYQIGMSVSVRNGKGEQALEIYKKRPNNSTYLAVPFFEHMKAEVLIQKEQYAEAETTLKIFLRDFKGRNFIKNAHWLLFLCRWLANDDIAASRYLKQVLTLGYDTSEADKAAQKFAENYFKKGPTPQQKTLTKARLAFDGGYLDRALKLLTPQTEKDFSRTDEKAEFQYRLGRIYQKTEQTDKAIPCYERAYALSVTEAYTHGARAALQLGYVYQIKNNHNKAIQNFRIALNYPKHDYKNSVDNKARAALTEMGAE